MAVTLNPYLNFRGNAREAMEFYQSVFGGQLDVMTFGDMPQAMEGHQVDPTQVMHSYLGGDNGIALMGSDIPEGMDATPNSSVSLSGDDAETLQGYWDKLSEDATIDEPLAQAPWGDSFGMLHDRFGTPWLINIAGTPAG